MSQYGIRIKNIKAGTLYGYNLGVRDRYEYKDAMFTNNLLGYFLLENGLKVYGNNSTRDIICLDFDFGSRSFEEETKHLESMIKQAKDDEDFSKCEKLTEILNKANDNKSNYTKKTKEEIRTEYYQDGVDVEYIFNDKSGKLKSKETIHYKMLYRSTGKAKDGSCMFINSKLYDKAHNFLYMGLELPKENAPIVEISAYSSLVASSIIDRIRINPKNILIVKDIDEYFNTNVISVETDEQKHCIAKRIDNYKLKNTLFDGQALIDSSIFPEDCEGYILLRHHMCKMACFNSEIQLFYKDYFRNDYNTAKVTDVFGNEHYARDIELITTDNAMKWLKFNISYDMWCDKVYENNCMFGIVKTAHKSKLGDVQKMSYQMVNSLDMDIMKAVCKTSKEYVESMKKYDNIFLDYLRDNKTFSNDYEVLVALCEQNMEFTRSEYFRDRKSRIIRTYISKLKLGKIIQDADNLVIVGSPYAMLLHSIREDIKLDTTFKFEQGTIQCFTERFKDNEYLAEFRSPFNSKNNMGYLHNVYDDRFFRYFHLGEQIIAVNMIGTDFQDRNNGSDMDSDSIYTTNQSDIVEYAKMCYIKFLTIVNNIPKETNKYDNTMDNYALIDNNISASKTAIGESSNIAQLALTYSYNFDDNKYLDYVCILSVLAQVAIDSAKRRFDIDIDNEIRRIKKDMNIDENLYPMFWKHVKDSKIKRGKNKFNQEKINKKLVCPMNYLCELKFDEFKPTSQTLQMDYFFQKFELLEGRRKSKKIEDLIQKYSLSLYSIITDDSDEEEDKSNFLLLREDFEELIKEISCSYISNNYIGLMSWLINRAFCIGYGVKNKKGELSTKLNSNKSILLKVLYDINKTNLLKCFSNNC